MSNVPMYGFGGGGGTGGTLTVTAPAGATVTVSKDGKTLTRVAGEDGVVVFRGLQSGTWTLSITDGTQTASKTAEIVADYATSITFFSATIHITYPAGATCTVTDGVTALTAPDTSGTWECVVSEPGTYMVKLDSGFYESVEITQDGETHTVDKWYLYKDGNQYDDLTGGFVKKSSDGTGGSHSLGTTAITINRNAGNGGAGGIYAIKATNLIDLTNINALYMAGKLTAGSGGGCVMKIYNGSGSQLAYSSSLNTSAETTVSIDTTGISGKCIVAIVAEGSASTPAATYSISKIWAA